MAGMLRGIPARSAVILLSTLVLSCTQASAPPEPRPLRVAATSGLSSFRARQPQGATPHAMELVYAQLSEHAEIVKRGDDKRLLRPHKPSQNASAALCRALAVAEPVDAKTASPEGCLLSFASPQAASEFDSHRRHLLATGPYQLHREFDTHGQVLAADAPVDARPIGAIEFRANPGRAAADIHVQSMPLNQAWRQLFAGQIDVVPNMSWLYRERFRGIASVRLLDIPVTANMHLCFNTRRSQWADVHLRREVARVIEPDAVAKLACGEPSCRVPDWEIPAPEAPTEIPPHITILALDMHSSAVIAARAISYRLRRHYGIEVDVHVVDIAELAARAEGTEHDMTIVPMGLLGVSNNLTRPLASHAGYAPDDFTKAAAIDDTAAMRTILKRDAPLVPLFQIRTFAAVDGAYCGGAPERSTSWAWLADLYPCDDGAQP